MNRSGTLPSQLLSFFLFLSKLNNLTASSFYIFCLALKFYSSAILIFLTFFLSPPPLTPSWRQVSSRFKPIKTSTSLVGLFRHCFKRWSCKFTRVRHSRTFLHFRTCGNENCQWKPGSSRGWIINTILGPLRLYSYPEWRTRFLAWFSTSALDMCVCVCWTGNGGRINILWMCVSCTNRLMCSLVDREKCVYFWPLHNFCVSVNWVVLKPKTASHVQQVANLFNRFNVTTNYLRAHYILTLYRLLTRHLTEANWGSLEQFNTVTVLRLNKWAGWLCMGYFTCVLR